MGNDDDHSDLGGLLFGYLLYREMRDGRLDSGSVFRAGCILVIVVGVALLGIVVLASLSLPRHSGGPTGLIEGPTAPGFAAPVWTAPPYATLRPAPTLEPTPSPTPKPTPTPGIGKRVYAGDGWAVTVTKVQRWRPRGYNEPGWRLITAYVKVRMPASDNDCVWPSMFFVTAKSGREYPGWEEGAREPALWACGDYHRPTTASGWVTFEVRNADAAGLVLTACPGDVLWCEPPDAHIRLP